MSEAKLMVLAESLIHACVATVAVLAGEMAALVGYVIPTDLLMY